jgi:hypothetical protein
MMPTQPDSTNAERLTQRIAVLQAAYATDRAENVSANLNALALVSAGLVYIAATAAYVLPRCSNQACSGSKVPLPVLWLLPLTPVCLMSFLVLILIGVIIRTNYILELEDELVEHTTIPTGQRRVAVPDGMHRSVRIFGPEGIFRFIALNILVYVGAFLIVVAYAGGVMYVASHGTYHVTWLVVWLIPTLIYMVLVAPAILGLSYAYKLVRTTSTATVSER